MSDPERLKRAWDDHRQSPEFRAEFERARQAFHDGDLDVVAAQIRQAAVDRARRRARRVQQLGRHVPVAEAAKGGWMNTEDKVAAHWERRLAAHLDAAWLRRCGYNDAPGEWLVGPEVLEITDVDGYDVDVYPTYALVKDGTPRVWGSSLRPSRDGVEEGWEWSIRLGWDDLSQSEADRFEELGMCVDDADMTMHVLGSHQEKPPIPERFVEAVALVAAK